ncbi:MAG TPA: hemolysin family protein [Anaeromyxobacteraceae bacterium]|nr:hemolysin family protein [Anaeromyxobacteraceae bacterium]
MEVSAAIAEPLALAAIGLLVIRATAASFEAALAALGSPRAEVLAGAPGAGRRARALGRLTAQPERTAATMRLLVALVSLGAGALLAVVGGALAPGWRAPGMALAVLFGALFTVALAAAGRRLGARHAEPVALALAPVVMWLSVPLGWLGDALGLLVAPFAGGRGRFSLPLPPLEEMERKLAEYARAKGNPADRTSELIHKVFEFRDKVARDVMVPRTDLVAVDIDTPVEEILRMLAEQGHSRIPVYRGTLDQIVGILHARDLVPLLANPNLIVLRDLCRPVDFVPWSKPVQALLLDMQRKHVHMMVVVDEYGGVMGAATLEDVLEEIVGDIQDEWDVDKGSTVELLADGTFAVPGGTPVADFNQATGAGVPEDAAYETVAGFLNTLAGAIPAAGDRLLWHGWTFTVSESDRRRATRVRVARPKRPLSAADGRAG